MFEWDEHNLHKIRAHRISQREVEEALCSNPVLVYQQDADGESRFVYYGESSRGRMLAIIATERDELVRVVTAYELDAGQKWEYLERRAEGE